MLRGGSWKSSGDACRSTYRASDPSINDTCLAADTIGFRYRWDEETQQFAHPTALVICTPDARISRYLYGIEYPAKTVRLSLVEASEGKIGTAVDQITLFCFHYDANARGYVLGASARMEFY